MTLAQSSVARHLQQTLTTSAQRDGGWSYYAGKSSRVEPTCWALLALHESWEDAASWPRFAAPHLEWLAAAQSSDGLLRDQPESPANFTANGIAALVCAQFRTWGPAVLAGRSRDAAEAATGPDMPRLLNVLISAKGVAVDGADVRQNNRLQGWPWMADTFSWLEPTAWCVLALKKSGARSAGAAARIDEGEKLILNRTCESGGWNYGNASVIGQDLRPYVPTTALALIALQDHRSAVEVERSVGWLREARLKEPSAMALALTAIWLRLYGLPADDVEARLADDLDRAERVGNLQALAMMLYALTATEHQVKAFRV